MATHPDDIVARLLRAPELGDDGIPDAPDVPPIQREAAQVITELRADLARVREASAAVMAAEDNWNDHMDEAAVHALGDAIDGLRAALAEPDETDEWDGEGDCPKCQGDWCDPEGGCIHDE